MPWQFWLLANKRLFVIRYTRFLALRFMRWYLQNAGRATRDGLADGGYIVWMSATDYHRHTVLVQGRNEEEFHAMVWGARERGLDV